jgi:hypothetical protein
MGLESETSHFQAVPMALTTSHILFLSPTLPSNIMVFLLEINDFLYFPSCPLGSQ